MFRKDRSLSLPSSGFQKTFNCAEENITVYKVLSRDPDTCSKYQLLLYLPPDGIGGGA